MAAPFVTTAKLFRQKLNTLPSLPSVYWENTGHMPTTSAVFLAPKMIPINGQLLDMAKRQTNAGIYSIAIYVPLNKGENQILGLMDSIYNLFHNVVSLIEGDFSVDIMAISRSQVRRDSNFAMGNIDIEWVNYN